MLNTLKNFTQIKIDPRDLDIPTEITLQDTGAEGGSNLSVILEIVFGVAGVVAMLVIVIAGIQFMLSRGDPQKSATARNAIIYAAIGLVLMTVAFSLVRYVVGAI